ncbi:cysteine peptidase family C39 domain-containing protein [Synechococcus lacustris Tous-12m]
MKRFKTPSVVQFEATECGAVSLYIILGYYEKWIPLEEIRSRCKVGRDGANLANTAKAAESFDLDVELFQFEPEELEAEFKCPCIVFWNNNHFLVVEGFSKNSVYLSDPARGRRKISKTEFTNSFSKFCIFLEPNRNFIKSGQQPSLLKRLMQLIGKNNTPGLLLSFILGLLTTLPTLGISAISTYFTDTVLTNMGSRSNGYIWILLLLTFLTMLSAELMYMINRRLQTSINEGILDNFFARSLRCRLNTIRKEI